MSKYFARFCFLTVVFLFKKRIAKNMWDSPEFYIRTMDLVCDLWNGIDAYKWMTRLNNLMVSYQPKATFAEGNRQPRQEMPHD